MKQKSGLRENFAENWNAASEMPVQVYSNSAQTHEHHFKVLNAQLKQAPEGQAGQSTPGQHSFKVAADIPMQSTFSFLFSLILWFETTVKNIMKICHHVWACRGWKFFPSLRSVHST